LRRGGEDDPRRRFRTGRQKRTHERELNAVFARRGTRHRELERVVEIALRDAPRDHRLRDFGRVLGHRLCDVRIVCDEPEQLRVAEILVTGGFPICLRPQISLVKQARFRVEQRFEPEYVARVNRIHRGTK